VAEYFEIEDERAPKIQYQAIANQLFTDRKDRKQHLVPFLGAGASLGPFPEWAEPPVSYPEQARVQHALDELGFNRQAKDPSVPIARREAGADRSVLSVMYDVFQRVVVFYDNYTVDIVNGDGKQATNLSFNLEPRKRAAFGVATEDARAFAFADDAGHVSIWFPAEGAASKSASRTDLQLPQPLVALSFARDGKRLAVLDRDGVVRLYAPSERAVPKP
jgi:hypothetical protein